MSNPANNPIWEQISNALKPLLASVDGTFGMFLIEREGAVAALMIGDEDKVNNEQLADTMALFKDRLADMESHAREGELDLSKGNSQSFVRDTKTGAYLPIKRERPEDN